MNLCAQNASSNCYPSSSSLRATPIFIKLSCQQWRGLWRWSWRWWWEGWLMLFMPIPLLSLLNDVHDGWIDWVSHLGCPMHCRFFSMVCLLSLLLFLLPVIWAIFKNAKLLYFVCGTISIFACCFFPFHRCSVACIKSG